MARGNCACTVFPDGTRYFLIAHNPDYVFRSADDVIKVDREILDREPDLARSHENSVKRSVSSIFEYARSNTWDYFITLTFDPAFCDRYDYADCCRLMSKFTDALRYRQCGWIIVPEKHTGETYLKKGLPIPPDYRPGAYHFHGLVRGNLPCVPSGEKDSDGHDIYNISCFKYGHTTASFVRSQARVSSYISKYLTKCDDAVPKGSKRYWASRNLAVPDHEIISVSDVVMADLAQKAAYAKKISNAYGEFDFFEISP